MIEKGNQGEWRGYGEGKKRKYTRKEKRISQRKNIEKHSGRAKRIIDSGID